MADGGPPLLPQLPPLIPSAHPDDAEPQVVPKV